MNSNPISNFFANTPHVVKNLIIINALMLFASSLFNSFMVEHFALFYPESPLFRPYQLLTHMFMHGGFMHFFFNMYALWMFGSILERVWGSQKFLFYYLATGLGAVVLYLFTQWLQISYIETRIGAETVSQFKEYLITNRTQDLFSSQSVLFDYIHWNSLIMTPSLGASGAVFGILLAFGMLYPETELNLMFPPITLKAKYFVLIYGAIELVLGLSNANTGIAHFAHLGGMLFGFLIIMYWKKTNKPRSRWN